MIVPICTSMESETYKLDKGEYFLRWHRGGEVLRQYIVLENPGTITITLARGDKVEVDYANTTAQSEAQG